MREIKGGFGVVSRQVMTNKDLTIEAKAIYAYLCSYAGNGDTCFPSIGTICSELCISPKRFYKNINILTDLGIVKKNKDEKEVYGVVPFIE